MERDITVWRRCSRIAVAGAAISGLAASAAAAQVTAWQVYANDVLIFDSNQDKTSITFPAILSQAAFNALPQNKRTGKIGVGKIAWQTLTDLTGNDTNRGRLNIEGTAGNKLSVAMECS